MTVIAINYIHVYKCKQVKLFGGIAHWQVTDFLQPQGQSSYAFVFQVNILNFTRLLYPKSKNYYQHYDSI